MTAGRSRCVYATAPSSIPAAPAEQGRSRTQERLQNADDEASNAAIAALLARTLDSRHGELVIHLDPAGNLQRRSLASLFDQPDTSITNDGNQPLLSQAKIDRLVKTLQTIAGAINARVAVLHNPYDADGKGKLVDGPLGTESVSSANEEAIRERWRGKTLRLLIRRIGEGAEDINEIRVCVVGNVDAGKSSLLGGELALAGAVFGSRLTPLALWPCGSSDKRQTG